MPAAASLLSKAAGERLLSAQFMTMRATASNSSLRRPRPLPLRPPRQGAPPPLLSTVLLLSTTVTARTPATPPSTASRMSRKIYSHRVSAANCSNLSTHKKVPRPPLLVEHSPTTGATALSAAAAPPPLPSLGPPPVRWLLYRASIFMATRPLEFMLAAAA